MIRGGGFARFGDDLLGGGNGFLRFRFLDLRRSGAGFFNQLVRLRIGLVQNFLTRGFGACEFLL